MENLSKAYEVLQQIISEDGYPVKKFRLHAKYPSVVKISSPDRDTIEIDFIDSKPKVKVKKAVYHFNNSFGNNPEKE